MKTFKDNQCTIKWVLNPCAYSKVKHIDVPLKALCEDVTEFENLDIEYYAHNKKLSPGDFRHPEINFRHLPPGHTKLSQTFATLPSLFKLSLDVLLAKILSRLW